MDSAGRRQGPRRLTQKVSTRMAKSSDSPAVTATRAVVGHRSVSRGRRPRRLVPGFLIKSLSDHYNAPGRLAEYKRQFQQAFRRQGDDPSILAIELETLARRAIMILTLRFSYRWCETDSSMDRQSVHSADIWTVWDRILPWPTSTDRRPARAICQVMGDEPALAASPEMGTLVDIIRKLFPTPALPPPSRRWRCRTVRVKSSIFIQT